MGSENNLFINKRFFMCAQHHDEKPNFILSVLQCKCPRCRSGNMFQNKSAYSRGFMKMNEACPVCGQPLNMEPGFYYGTNMVSYTLAVLLSVFSFFAWWLLIGFSLQDSRFFWWLGINAFLLVALQPSLMRLSRAVWLAFFVRYSPGWREGDIIERYSVNKEQESNW
jgi:uncharacterized protein (DUF983 family)